MPLRTKLTEKLGISHPVLLAPMGTASGGTLAKAVTEAGGFGIIGFGYGNQERSIRNFGRPAMLAWAAVSSRGHSPVSRIFWPGPWITSPQPSCSPSAMPDLLSRRSKTQARRCLPGTDRRASDGSG